MARPMQQYPRIKGTNLLDDSKLVPHIFKIPPDKVKEIILAALAAAQKKSSRAILDLPDDVTDDIIQQIYKQEGGELFRYFLKYYGDPAGTAHQCLNRHYSVVAKEQFRNRTLQMERMNTAWRYQFIAKDAAAASKRFDTVSDIGLEQADFNVVIKYRDAYKKLDIYISVKNRSNTLGGQDWPKAIEALENVAVYDRNRHDEYICVFGITIERGQRAIRKMQKSGVAYSANTEIWFSDFFWPFFTNYSYEEITKIVLEVLISTQRIQIISEAEVPEELVESFGECCRHFRLLDKKGNFHDAFKLVELFCRHQDTSGLPKRPSKKKHKELGTQKASKRMAKNSVKTRIKN